MKKKIILTSGLALTSFLGITQMYQTTIHTNALRLQAQNTAVKIAKTTAYKDLIVNVEESKNDMLKAKLAIEEAHRLTYKALTDVHSGIKEAKKFYYTLQAIERIHNNLSKAYDQALGIKVFSHFETQYLSTGTGLDDQVIEVQSPVYKNPILPLHVKYNKLIIERIVNLVAYVKGFIQDGTTNSSSTPGSVGGGSNGGGIGGSTELGTGVSTGEVDGVDGGSGSSTASKTKNIISNIVRERFLSEVYQKVYTIEVLTKSYLYGMQTVRWQHDANNIIPYQMFINDNRILVERIKSKLNF